MSAIQIKAFLRRLAADQKTLEELANKPGLSLDDLENYGAAQSYVFDADELVAYFTEGAFAKQADITSLIYDLSPSQLRLGVVASDGKAYAVKLARKIDYAYLFSYISTHEGGFAEAEAFLGFGMTAMAIDGELSEAELNEIVGIIDRLELPESLMASRAEINMSWAELVDAAQEELAKLGVPEYYQRAKSSLPKASYPLAFKFALRVALADNEIMSEENDFLIQLSRDLGITSQQLQEMARSAGS